MDGTWKINYTWILQKLRNSMWMVLLVKKLKIMSELRQHFFSLIYESVVGLPLLKKFTLFFKQFSALVLIVEFVSIIFRFLVNAGCLGHLVFSRLDWFGLDVLLLLSY
jgi:hypothetical protein